MKRKELIVDPYFVSGLFILLLNDLYLKYEYGNFITGKLSDFAGLLIFPLFIAALLPKLGRSAAIITGIGFILWKLPMMDPVIDRVNELSGIGISRVIDYSDYIALLILPLSHYLINYRKNQRMPRIDKLVYFSKIALSVTAIFAFCATSVQRYATEVPKGTIYIGKSYNIKLPKDSVIGSVKKLGYNCDYKDEWVFSKNTYSKDTLLYQKRGYYQTDNIVRYWTDINRKDTISTDTITCIKYELTEVKPGRTKLTVINVTLPEKGSIQNWRTLMLLSEQYEEWLKNNLIKKID